MAWNAITQKRMLIDTSIPSQWDSYTVERIYRGCRLTIQVENPAHVQHGVKEATNIISEFTEKPYEGE